MIKAAFAFLSLLSYFAGLVERWQLKSSIRAEDERDQLREITAALLADKKLETVLRSLLHSDPTVRDRMRRHYQRLGVLPPR